MRRVLKVFTADRDGWHEATKLMKTEAKLLTKLGFGRTHGVYVDRTLPRGHPKRKFAPWAVFVTDQKTKSPELDSTDGVTRKATHSVAKER